MKKEAAFSGLEAAIVLIAFVVVAAVFSYVMLGAGFFATQKSQEVTYSGIKQSTSNLVLDGQIYGDTNPIGTLTLYLSIPEGGQAQNMAQVEFLFTKDGSAVSKLTNSLSGLLQPGNRQQVSLTTDAISAGHTFTLEIKPKVGASSLVTKTLSTGYTGGVII